MVNTKHTRHESRHCSLHACAAAARARATRLPREAAKSINRTMTGPRCRRPSGTTEMPWLSKGWQGRRVPVRATSVHNSEHSVTHMRAHINDKAANGIAIDAMYTRALGPCSSNGDMNVHMTTHPHTHTRTDIIIANVCMHARTHLRPGTGTSRFGWLMMVPVRS
jgi:hypothetical protein